MGKFENLKQDIPASIVVFFVAVPLCLGIALASGAPLFSGLIAGIVGGIVVGIISGSHLGVSGPAAGLAVIVLEAINGLGFEAFLVAVVLAGGIQVVLGLARSGFVAYFFPSAVIKGMLAGIGIIIILKQIPHAFGRDSDPEGDMAFQQIDGETTFSALTHLMSELQLGAIVITLISMAILILWDTVLVKKSKVFQLVQGPLVAVVVGILFQLFAADAFPSLVLDASHLVTVPVADGLSGIASLFTFPDWSALTDKAVLIAAVTIAVVASLETLLCVEATDKMDPQKRTTPTNRELIAQGVGNSVSGVLGGLPVTQVIVRSSANIQSGARSKTSAILHGVFLLISVFLLPTVLNLIPLAVLASILFIVGYKLAKPALFKQMYQSGWDQFLPFMVTILGIVFTDLLMGIAMGMVVALASILRRNFLGSFEVSIKDTESDDHTHMVTVKLAEEVSFLNRASIVDAFAKIPDGSFVRFDLTKNRHMDADIAELIEEFKVNADYRNITVE